MWTFYGCFSKEVFPHIVILLWFDRNFIQIIEEYVIRKRFNFSVSYDGQTINISQFEDNMTKHKYPGQKITWNKCARSFEKLGWRKQFMVDYNQHIIPTMNQKSENLNAQWRQCVGFVEFSCFSHLLTPESS